MTTTYADYQTGPDRLVLRTLRTQLAVPGAMATPPGVLGDQPAARGSRRCCSPDSGVWCSLVITVVPVRGRSATGLDGGRRAAYAVGGLARVDSVSRSQGRAGRRRGPGRPGPARGPAGRPDPRRTTAGLAAARVAVIQDHATKTWAVTASVVHPGIGMDDVEERRPVRRGTGRAARRRGAHREDRRDPVHGPHRPRGRRRARTVGHAPPPRPTPRHWPTQINADLAAGLTQASVRTETVRHLRGPRDTDRPSRPRSPAAASRAAAASCTC